MYFRLQKPLDNSVAFGQTEFGFWAKTHWHSTAWRGLKPCDLVPAESILIPAESWGPGHGTTP